MGWNWLMITRLVVLAVMMLPGSTRRRPILPLMGD